MTETLDPIPPYLLAHADVDALLTAAYALTHRIHECRGSIVAGRCDGPCVDLRAQRDMIAAEIKSRCES